MIIISRSFDFLVEMKDGAGVCRLYDEMVENEHLVNSTDWNHYKADHIQH